MDIETFEKIKQKLEILKQKKAKAEGAIENIEQTWKKEGINTLEEAQQKLTELEQKEKELETTVENLYAELKNLTNWNTI